MIFLLIISIIGLAIGGLPGALIGFAFGIFLCWLLEI
jgi:hypothetical protein